MVNNGARKSTRKSRGAPETQAQKDRILHLLSTYAPRDNSPVPVPNHSSRPSTSTSNRKRRAPSTSPVRGQQPSVSRPKRIARASAVKAKQTMREIINGSKSDDEEEVVDDLSTQSAAYVLAPNGTDSDEEEVVANPSLKTTTSGSSNNKPRLAPTNLRIELASSTEPRAPTEPRTNSLPPNRETIRDDQAQNNDNSSEEVIVKQEPKEAENTFPERVIKTEPQIGRNQENVAPERKNIQTFDQMEAKSENINMNVAIHDNSNQGEQPDSEADDDDVVELGYEMEPPSDFKDYLDYNDDYDIAAAGFPVQSQPTASETVIAPPTQAPVSRLPSQTMDSQTINAPLALSTAEAPTSSRNSVPATAIDVGAPRTLSEAVVIPQTQESAAAAVQQAPKQPQQDQVPVRATSPPVVQVVVAPVVRLDRPQRPEYLNAERAALFRLPRRSNDFRTWNATDVYEWLGMLPNQSATFTVLRQKILEFDGSGDFLNQLLSGPESVKMASEMLEASILHLHSIKRHVAALENSLLEADYHEAVQKYEQQNN
ncbi:unnamed protein product [Caenorhabditis nigoni]|uniref:Uncharacterized protein n=1 Tax=Caenorhabditis nigoni TaxID=1611254 RepID=A0A2G5SAZ7_9PELO|nr:hypothetical protein B9Z55_028644 [Caenorhabditis nigoni]